MKKFKAYTILAILSIIGSSFIISSTITPIVSAAGGEYDSSWGNQDTARKKEWFSMINDCATMSSSTLPQSAWDTSSYGFLGVYSGITSSKLKSGDWFKTGWAWTFWPDNHSPYVEKEITGEYDDGTFNCGDNNNALVKKGLPILQVDRKEVICNYEDDSEHGLLYPAEAQADCGVYYDSDSKDVYFGSIDLSGYFEKVVMAKNQSNASLGSSMSSLSDLEQYFVEYDAFISACVVGGAQDSGGTYTIQELDKSTNKLKTVHYNGYANSTGKGPDSNIPYFLKYRRTCNGLAKDLNGENEDDQAIVGALKAYAAYLDKNGTTLDEDNTTDEVKKDDDAESTCQNSGGAGSLGWIVCSILDWMSEATNELYSNIVKPALQVESDYFDSDNATYTAWTQFQNIANTIFVILVLAVIFSQLTGIGIDNYGIKKILPKLIVVAILINLSYIICVLCVDLSNILGNGLQNFFNNLPISSITSDTITVTVKSDPVNANVGADIGIISVGLVSGAVGAAAIFTNSALLLTLFVSVLGVLIAVLFLFILLAGRKALIILLVVVSPIAFILYSLPNTKKIFDKWLKLWEAMLILYPVCGLLIGGGNFASRLILSVGGENGGAGIIFTAMVIGIIPIFLIPTLVKGAFSALGSFGGAIAGFGGRLRGGFEKGARNTNAYKVAQKRGQARRERFNQRAEERRTMGRAGLRANGKKNLRGRLAEHPFGKAWGMDRTVNEARSEYYKNQGAKEKMYDEIFDREPNKDNIETELARALGGGDAERATSAFNALIKRGGISETFNALNNANWSTMDEGVKNRMVRAMGGSNIDAMKGFSIYKSAGGNGSFQQWAEGKANDKNTAKYGSYANYLQKKGDNAMNGYGKDEMKFVSGLQNDLINSKELGAQGLGRLIANAGINSSDAQAKTEAYGIMQKQIGSGAMKAEDLGLSASGAASMDSGMSDAIINGYSDYIANTYPNSPLAQTKGAAEAMARAAFSQQINDIKADSTGRYLGKMDPKTRKNLGL